VEEYVCPYERGISFWRPNRGLSAAKPGAKSSVERQVKERISALRDFLAGRSGEAKVAEAGDKATRQVVAEELLAVMSRTATDATEEPSGCAQDVSAGDVEAMPLSDSEGISLEQRQPKPGDQEEQQRARQLFIDQGYFDEAVQGLRGANSSEERAAAARILGLVGSKRGTAHLIAAMFDDDPEVRNAAEEALAQMGGRAASNVPVNARLSGEPDSEKLRVVEAFPSAQRPSVSEAPSQESDEPDQQRETPPVPLTRMKLCLRSHQSTTTARAYPA